jgi:LuxR family transcriptional regulator, maltose regulon positive regulatory protein
MLADRPYTQNNWLVQTKFLAPEKRSDIPNRPRLLTALSTALRQNTLTLISAPAGSGKTTLLANLTEVVPEMPFAWLAMDTDDNTLTQFLKVIIAALQNLNPQCGITAGNLILNSPDLKAEYRQVTGVLINEIMQTLPLPFGLVLDDLHEVTNLECFNALNYLLERIPPQMKLVIATRHDPPIALARLRTRRQVAEFRLNHLRFTEGETAQLFNQTLQYRLHEEELKRLYAHTEGWAAGISLVASFLEQKPGEIKRINFLEQVEESERYIFDFLAAEVLDAQTGQIRNFLLKTAILYELTPNLCQAVADLATPPVAHHILESLYHHNLFMVKVEPQTPSYRYHDLFRDFLIHKLELEQPETLNQLYLKAGKAETIPIRVILLPGKRGRKRQPPLKNTAN